MKSTKLYILIALLLTIVASVSYYLYQIKKENDLMNSIYVGDIPNADEIKKIIRNNIKTSTEQHKIMAEDSKIPPKPITDFSEIDTNAIEIDPKLYTNKEAVLNTKELKIDYDLKEATFCGEVYKAKQIIIDGVDITQRLSEILLEDKDRNNSFCEQSMSSAKNTGGVIDPGEEVRLVLYTGEEGDNYEYGISFGRGLTDLSKNKFPPYSLEFGFGIYILVEKNIFSVNYIIHKLHNDK